MISEAVENGKLFLMNMFQFRLASYYLLKTRHWKWWQWKVGIENTSEFSLQKRENFFYAFPKAESKKMLASFSSELRTFVISKVSREILPEKRSYALLVHRECMHVYNACITMYVLSNLELILINSTLQIYAPSLWFSPLSIKNPYWLSCILCHCINKDLLLPSEGNGINNKFEAYCLYLCAQSYLCWHLTLCVLEYGSGNRHGKGWTDEKNPSRKKHSPIR